MNIPEDVMNRAKEAHARFADSRVTDNLTDIIARAILTDREARTGWSGRITETGDLRDQRNWLIARGIDPNLDTLPPSPSLRETEGEKEDLAEINTALKTINDTCAALQYDDRGRYGVETIGPLRDVATLINKLVFQHATSPKPNTAAIRVQAIEDVLSALTAHELYQYRPKAFKGFIDYARSTLINDEEAKVWQGDKPDTSALLLEAEKALEPFASLPDNAHGKSRYFIQLLVCPEGDTPTEGVKDYGGAIRAARSTLAKIRGRG